MLRSEHSIVRYKYQQRRIEPDRLRRGRDDAYVSAAKILLRIYRDGIGRTRQTLHRNVEEVLARLSGCPPRRIAAFCKLLDDHSAFQCDKKAAVDLRRKVFSIAADMHPIVQNAEENFEHTIELSRQTISESVGISWPEIDVRLFSDVIELQTLQAFDSSIDPVSLLSIYNVSQTQAALYRAARMTIDARDDFKTILRHAKLAGLMHRISRKCGTSPGYRFEFDGPQSSLRETSRYGIRFASMLPKLLACRRWLMIAEVIGPNQARFQLRLSPEDGLSSTLDQPADFDSELEREIFAAWTANPVTNWTMHRESELLHHGQTVLTPDFVLQHLLSGRKIYLEVVGYWTPEYLEHKCRRVKKFIESGPPSKWLLVFAKAKAAERQAIFADLPVRCIVFDKRSRPVDWIQTMQDASE